MATKTDELLRQQSLGSDSVERLLGLVQDGTLLNERLQAWEDRASAKYTYQTIDASQCWPNDSYMAITGANIIHIYDSVSVGNLWNCYRTTRLYLIRLVLRAVFRLATDEVHAPEITTDHGITVQLVSQRRVLADDICASVPYMLGEVDQQAHLQNARQSKAVGGLFLLWPLGTLLFMDFLPSERSAWIKERLTYIRDGLGIQQAKVALSVADS